MSEIVFIVRICRPKLNLSAMEDKEIAHRHLYHARVDHTAMPIHAESTIVEATHMHTWNETGALRYCTSPLHPYGDNYFRGGQNLE